MSHTFVSLSAQTMAELEEVLAKGTAPSFSTLCGAEFRGWNIFGNATAAAVGTVMGIQRFAKGFFVREGEPDAAPFVEGYNIKIRRGRIDEPWLDLVDNAVTRHAFFRVHRAGEGNHGGRHPHALLLDYSLGDPMPGLLDGKNLKDYVVHPDPANRDLILGKAYFLLGPLVNVNFFVAERLRSSTFSPPARTRS